MRVAFRADASQQIGIGHVMRCLTLANELADMGAECHFLCCGTALKELIVRRHKFYELPFEGLENDSGDRGGHSHWLPSGWRADVDACFAKLHSLGPMDWIVVDHYALDWAWEGAIRCAANKVMVIDDLADRSHDCEILLDQNLANSMQTRYAGKVPKAAKLMLGPTYALLRPEFLFARQTLQARNGDVQRIFLFMGGGDSDNVTATVLDALCQSKHKSLAIDVVVGSTNLHWDDIQARCSMLPNSKLYKQIEDMASLMVSADLAIGATGVATWERAALGVPTLAVSLADNQRSIARQAHAAGILTWLGDATGVSVQEWIRRIDEACSSVDVLRRQYQACLSLVDAKGTQRVVEAMQ